MSNMTTIKVELRTQVGKSAARATRRLNRVPAVIYGNDIAAKSISLDSRELKKLVGGGSFLTSICLLKLGENTIRTIPCDIHFDPVHDFVTHVDFLHLRKDARVSVNVPIRFLNDQASPGIKRGGALNIVRHEIELNCTPENMPDHLDVDLTGLEIGDSVHVSSITLSADVKLTISDRDFTIATITTPVGMSEDAQNKANEEK
ncbi:MAG: 50S ribosomal protein L25/general stress protein Ctc [Alphaproteobacteria bacterium]|nr:50S ribosomal protein L25/general stress protein Ctc [Alphaproteobacteria bacterium]